MLSTRQIKARLPFGVQRVVAQTLDLSPALVSGVVSKRYRNREVQRSLWLLMREPDGRTMTHTVRSLTDVFGPPVAVKMRAERAA